MSRSVPFLHCLLVLLGWLALAPAQAATPRTAIATTTIAHTMDVSLVV